MTAASSPTRPRALTPCVGDLVLTPSGRLAIVLRETADGRLVLRYARGMDGEVTLPAALLTVTARVGRVAGGRIADKPA